MGNTIHDAIIVSGFRKESVAAARAKALMLDMRPTEVVESEINGWCHFLIPPDGSKDGWPESNLGDERRELWITWAREQWANASTPPFAGGCFVYYVHVQYHETDDGKPVIAGYQPDDESPR
jgi:hypothetical protein